MKKLVLAVSLSVLFLVTTITVIAYTDMFLDQNTFDDWYKISVERMRSSDIITGYPDGEFKPYNNVNRAELAVILNRFATAGQIDLTEYSGGCDDIYVSGLEFHLQDIEGNPINNASIRIEGPDSYLDYNDFENGASNGDYHGLGERSGYFVIEISKDGYNSHKESLELKMDGLYCHVVTQYRTITLTPSVD
ncbi:MAG: S-layer homology domain-containing protein [Candidatus Gracilibacteria bacterium]